MLKTESPYVQRKELAECVRDAAKLTASKLLHANPHRNGGGKAESSFQVQGMVYIVRVSIERRRP
ncbi:MAG: hypothetical protein ACRYG8_23370 [Janthinobacterium lividum]